MTFTHALSTNNYGQKFIVATSAANGTHVTLASAMAVASVGDTIVLRDSVTENVTITPGVNITALSGSNETPTVSITGTLTMTGAGTSTISNVRLVTNSAFVVAVTGSAASVLHFYNCYVSGTNNTSISYTSSSSSSGIAFLNSSIVITSGAAFASTGAGSLGFNKCYLSQTTSTANTFTAGFLTFTHCYNALSNIVTSGTSDYQSFESHHTAGNVTGPCVTHGGTGVDSYVLFSDFQNNNAAGPAISVSAGATLKCGQITATNFNGSVASISGAGTISYSEIGSLITTNTVTVTTQTRNPVDMGAIRAALDSTFGVSNSGAQNTLNVQNPSNTAGSIADVLVSVGGTSAGDAQYQASVTGGNFWTWGVDNSDTDAFVLSSNAGLGTNNTIHITTAGEINYPLQPAFLAYLAADDANVTGNAADYVLGTNTALTEVFDQNSDFATNGVFTAPVTGRYFLSGCTVVIGGSAAMTFGQCYIGTSNRAHGGFVGNYSAIQCIAIAAGFCGFEATSLCDMDAADTASFHIQLGGGVGNTADLQGTGAQANTRFSGYLVC